MRYRTRRRTPSCTSVSFRAVCFIQASFGWQVMPAISTVRVLRSHHEEDEVPDPAQGQHFDREEVSRRQAIPMSGQECLPGRLRAALGCWVDAVVLEDRLD